MNFSKLLVPTGNAHRYLMRLMVYLAVGSLLLPTPALADEDKAPPSGRSSGGRGCGSTSAPTVAQVPALILLNPHHQRGKTVSTRPTFAWFVRDPAPRLLEFRLYEVEAGQFKLVKEVKGNDLKSTPGITVLQLAATDPELVVGKRYRWQVELVCNPGRPSGNLFAEAEVEVVRMQSDLKTQLLQSDDRLKQAQLYVQIDLWHDAIEQVLVTSRQTDVWQNLRRSLLDRVALNDAERTLLQTSPIVWVQLE